MPRKGKKCQLCGHPALEERVGYWMPHAHDPALVAIGSGRMVVGTICGRCLAGSMALYADLHGDRED